MSDWAIDYYGDCIVRISGSGTVVRELHNYFNNLITNNVPEDTDLVIEIWEEPPDPDVCLGDPGRYYGRDGDRFLIRRSDPEFFVSLNESWDHIRVSPGTQYSYLVTLIEYAVRRDFLQKDRVLVHASGVVRDNQTILLPAWSHTGKTNTSLSLLQTTNDGELLSDDRVWVSSDGDVWGYPLRVGMYWYNMQAFPAASPHSYIDLKRNQLSNIIYNNFDRDGLIFEKILYFIAKDYIDKDLRRVLDVSDLIPDSSYGEKNEIDEMVFMRTKPELRGSDISLESLSVDTALRDLEGSNFYQWNNDVEEYCLIHDMLFDDSNHADDYEHLVNREYEILEELLGDTNIKMMYLPREEKWDESNISQHIIAAVESL